MGNVDYLIAATYGSSVPGKGTFVGRCVGVACRGGERIIGAYVFDPTGTTIPYSVTAYRDGVTIVGVYVTNEEEITVM